MGWPQVAYISLTALGLGTHLARHGQPRADKYSIWTAMTAAAISAGIVYAGGFFG